MSKQIFSFYLVSLAAVLLIFSVSCSDIITEPERVRFATEILPAGGVYEISDGQRQIVKPVIINRSDVPIHFIVPTRDVKLQFFDGEKWVDKGNWLIFVGILTKPAELKPGQSLEYGGLDIAGSQNLVDRTGLYRFSFPFYRSRDFKQLIPETSRFSEPFEIIFGPKVKE